MPGAVVRWSDDVLDGVLDEVAWQRLAHAYGDASDTPGQLRGLTAADATTRKAALRHLWGTVTHQESVHTATGPVAEMLARMLTGDRLARPSPADEKSSMRANLLSYLGHVAAWGAYFQANPNPVACVRGRGRGGRSTTRHRLGDIGQQGRKGHVQRLLPGQDGMQMLLDRLGDPRIVRR
jgi:hypothetical protein